MSHLATARLTLQRLKHDARQFKTATATGTLTPAQIQKLGAMLVDTVDLLDALLNKNNDVALSGAKIADQDGTQLRKPGSLGLRGGKVGQN